jgi:hypothetical protein
MGHSLLRAIGNLICTENPATSNPCNIKETK